MNQIYTRTYPPPERYLGQLPPGRPRREGEDLPEYAAKIPRQWPYAGTKWASGKGPEYQPKPCSAPEKTHVNSEWAEAQGLSWKSPPLDFFTAFRRNDWERFATWTDDYVKKKKYREKEGDIYRKEKFHLVDRDAILDFLIKYEGLLLWNGISPKPRVRDHFSQDNNGLGSPCVIRAFGNIAGGYRIVEQLRHVLRFQDPEALRPTEGEFKDDKAHLVRPMLKNLRRVLLDAIVAAANMLARPIA